MQVVTRAVGDMRRSQIDRDASRSRAALDVWEDEEDEEVVHCATLCILCASMRRRRCARTLSHTVTRTAAASAHPVTCFSTSCAPDHSYLRYNNVTRRTQHTQDEARAIADEALCELLADATILRIVSEQVGHKLSTGREGAVRARDAERQ